VTERFTEATRAAIGAAQQEAGLMRHRHIGTEHLLVALAGDPTIAPLLAPFELSRERARAEVVKAVGMGEHEAAGELTFTAAARDALEAALQEAVQAGSDRVEPAHLLLGVLRQRDGVARRVLVAAGASPREFREAVLSGIAPPPPAVAVGSPRADAQLLLGILERGGPVAAWLRERGVDEDAVRPMLR
jgi:ATP-dependent Clp protease ATP-binding subunit ClpC